MREPADNPRAEKSLDLSEEPIRDASMDHGSRERTDGQ